MADFRVNFTEFEKDSRGELCVSRELLARLADGHEPSRGWMTYLRMLAKEVIRRRATQDVNGEQIRSAVIAATREASASVLALGATLIDDIANRVAQKIAAATLPSPPPVLVAVAQAETDAVRRLNALVIDPSCQPGLRNPVLRLLQAHESAVRRRGAAARGRARRSPDHRIALSSSDRDGLQIYAEACGATYGDPEAGAAISLLLGMVT